MVFPGKCTLARQAGLHTYCERGVARKQLVRAVEKEWMLHTRGESDFRGALF